MSGYRVLCLAALIALGISQMLGPADVQLRSVEPCPEGGPYQYQLDMRLHKINRTTDAFDINLSIDIWIDDQVGIYFSIVQLLDGGYKKAYEIRDDNMCEFLMKHAEQQLTTILRLVGLEEKCPMPPGSYSVHNYTFNFDNLPPMIYGDFKIDMHATEKGKAILCIRMHMIAKPKDPVRYVGG